MKSFTEFSEAKEKKPKYIIRYDKFILYQVFSSDKSNEESHYFETKAEAQDWIKKNPIKEGLHEAKSSSGYELYHKTMSGALGHAKDQAEKRGYEVDMDDWDRKVAMGPRKPSKDGESNAYSLKLTKKGKPTREALHAQVTNLGNRFELNMYIQ